MGKKRVKTEPVIRGFRCVICKAEKPNRSIKNVRQYGNSKNPEHARYCERCAPDEEHSYLVTTKYCVADKCKITAIYGIENKLHCEKHHLPGELNLNKKTCTHVVGDKKCGTTATYGFLGGTPIFCSPHADKNIHVDLKHNDCPVEGCDLKVRFGFKYTTKLLFCSNHCDRSIHADLTHPVCDIKECLKGAAYGNIEDVEIGTRGYKRCREHREEHHVHLRIFALKQCTIESCNLPADYGVMGNLRITCFNHKEPHYKNIRSLYNNYCIVDDCVKLAYYGTEEDKLKLYCGNHRDRDIHINLCVKRCEMCKDTSLVAKFGEKYTNKAILCEFCRDEFHPEYVNVRKINCEHENCDGDAEYNVVGRSARFCILHKKQNMVTNSMKKCACGMIATKLKNRLFYCGTCADADAVGICNVCVACFVPVVDDEIYCEACTKFVEDGGKSMKRLQKEEEVKRFLNMSNILLFSYNKPIKDSLYRPDFVIKIDNYNVIILECDEFQHNRSSGYDCSCEIKRMKGIFFDIFKANIKDVKIEKQPKMLFIRYNPDKYISIEQFSKQKKLEYLVDYIKNFKFDVMQTGLYVKYLFYDGFISDSLADLDKINPYED